MLSQCEYDSQMAQINNEIQSIVAPIQAKINQLANRRASIKRKMAELRVEEAEISRTHFNLCDEVRKIKQKYNDRKSELYLQRPMAYVEDNTEE